MKKVSVITVCYNEKDGIRETVESVLAQTAREEIEYIVLDGGSSDGTMGILESYRSGIDFIDSGKDLGIYDAMNKGIRKATGEYLLFMNGGDRFYSDTIVEEVIAAGLDADIVYGDGLVDRYETLHPLPHVDGKLKPELFFQNASFCHQAEFIRRELFGRVGSYDLSYSIICDHVFNYRAITKYGATTKYIPAILARIDETGVTMTKLDQVEKEKRRLAEESLSGSEKARRRLRLYFGAAKAAAKKVKRFLRRAAKAASRRVGL
jgi:glycosyltransferase involved in cell wall biosynthesis